MKSPLHPASMKTQQRDFSRPELLNAELTPPTYPDLRDVFFGFFWGGGFAQTMSQAYQTTMTAGSLQASPRRKKHHASSRETVQEIPHGFVAVAPIFVIQQLNCFNIHRIESPLLKWKLEVFVLLNHGFNLSLYTGKNLLSHCPKQMLSKKLRVIFSFLALFS